MRFSKKCGKPSILGIFDHFGSIFGQTRPKMSNFRVFLKNQTRHFFTLPKTSIHVKNKGNQIYSFRKNAENFRFWAFLTILAQNGQFWTDAAQNVQFSSFPEKKQKRHFLHSLRLAFMQKIREI